VLVAAALAACGPAYRASAMGDEVPDGFRLACVQPGRL